jgi:hypothetical protein
MFYYVLSPNTKKDCVGKVVARHKCLTLTKRHRTVIEKGSSFKMIIVKSEKEKHKNSNMMSEDVIEYC